MWLTQAQMAELFQVTVPNINVHIRKVLEEGELEANRTIKDYLIVRRESPRMVRRTADWRSDKDLCRFCKEVASSAPPCLSGLEV
jgi:hypothetical protein